MPWTAGAVLTAAQLNTHLPQDYSVQVSSVVNLPLSGSSVHRYRQAGKKVEGEFYFIASGAGGGTYSILLPVVARTAPGGQARAIGQVAMTDMGTAVHPGILFLSTTTQAQILLASTAAASTTVPFTWASGDVIAGTYCYEAA